MNERRKRTEYAPQQVENSVSDEKLAAFVAAREKALQKKRDEAKEKDN